MLKDDTETLNQNPAKDWKEPKQPREQEKQTQVLIGQQQANGRTKQFKRDQKWDHIFVEQVPAISSSKCKD